MTCIIDKTIDPNIKTAKLFNFAANIATTINVLSPNSDKNINKKLYPNPNQN